MNNKRESGILCHITSLPGEFGFGDLGKNAYMFADMLKETNQKLWQILPLSPVGGSASPYQGLSAFAGNPYLISLEKLAEEGYLTENELYHNDFNPYRADFNKIFPWKAEILKTAANRFSETEEYDDFVKQNKYWLNDYALFTAIKKIKGTSWTKWQMTKAEEKAFASENADLIQQIKILQFFFFKQWKQLKEYVNKKGIKIIGDLPIFLDFEAESLWAFPKQFLLTKDNKPACVSGVPPDYFCADGQYWGNPMYDWETMKADNYSWWKKRFKLLFQTVDIIRIDHFRAFSEAWQIRPNKQHNACKGHWQKGPGKDFFENAVPASKRKSIIAEDLGIIDDKVRNLRDECDFPGMCILQFAFDGSDNLYLPHNHIKNQIVYTGTHDNNTAIGWWNEQDETTKDRVRRYLSIDGNCINQQLMRTAAMSSADTAIYTMQDILGLDESGRMNIPGVAYGNWGWRFTWKQVTEWQKDFLKEITELYKR